MGTGATLLAWNAAPWPVLRGWLAGSAAVTVGLLLAVWGVASASVPDPTPVRLPDDVGQVVARNGLVLALHALACVAGYIAGSSMPREAQRYDGWLRRIHELAPGVAMTFVAAATLFSLATQALALGQSAASLAAQLGVSPGELLLLLSPHAIPELVALFLPLAAWLRLSGQGRADELLAATVATVALALPALLIAALVEVLVTPRLLLQFV
jgi:hypothetical protein